ncbi:MAG: hypothetical protein Q9217_003669 [Psora testacea]
MSTPDDARLGFWIDYNRRNIDKCQVLATDFWSRFMTGIVAVSLTLITPYIFKFVKSFLVWLFGLVGSLAATWQSSGAAEQSSSSISTRIHTPLLRRHSEDSERSQRAKAHAADAAPVASSDHASSGRDGAPNTSSISQNGDITHLDSQAWGDARSSALRTDNFMRIMKTSTSSRETVRRFAEYLVHRGKAQCESPSIAIVVITTVLFGLFVAQAVAGVFSAKIASDRAGLASSKHYGIWQFDKDAGQEAADRDDLDNYRKEARASQYARTCYKSQDPRSPFSYGMFYNQSIIFETRTHQLCPFASPELCMGGLYSAVTFDTGLIDGSVIGINAPVTHKFRRSTTCSPLNTSEPYIMLPLNYVKRLMGDSTYFSSLYPENDYWRPIPELKPPNDSTVTIIFVSSMHIYHAEPSFDPIFYATKPHYFNDYREPYYYNADPRARALACVDKSEVCSPDGNVCWSMASPAPNKVPSPPAYWLMKWALENSNIYDSIKWRLGTALLAQESISQSVSMPLPPDQWQLETSQLFATSLARIQYDAWGIAVGEDRQRPGYIDVTPDEAKGRLCGLYIFKTSDYTNVNLVAFIALIVLAITIFILSLQARTIGLNTRYDDKRNTSSQTLVIEVIVNFAYDLILEALKGIWTGARSLYRRSKGCSFHRRSRA